RALDLRLIDLDDGAVALAHLHDLRRLFDDRAFDLRAVGEEHDRALVALRQHLVRIDDRFEDLAAFRAFSEAAQIGTHDARVAVFGLMAAQALALALAAEDVATLLRVAAGEAIGILRELRIGAGLGLVRRDQILDRL